MNQQKSKGNNLKETKSEWKEDNKDTKQKEKEKDKVTKKKTKDEEQKDKPFEGLKNKKSFMRSD